MWGSASVLGAEKGNAPLSVGDNKLLVQGFLVWGAVPLRGDWELWLKVGEHEGYLVGNTGDPLLCLVDGPGSSSWGSVADSSCNFVKTEYSAIPQACFDMIKPVAVVVIVEKVVPFQRVEVSCLVYVFAEELEERDGECFSFRLGDPVAGLHFRLYKLPFVTTKLVVVTSKDCEDHIRGETSDGGSDGCGKLWPGWF